jgi:hypothetical protein
MKNLKPYTNLVESKEPVIISAVQKSKDSSNEIKKL